MSMEEMMDRIRKAQELMADESRKMAASEMVSKAKLKELDAAIMLGDEKSIEDARVNSLAAFEAFLDARIAGNRRVRELSVRG